MTYIRRLFELLPILFLPLISTLIQGDPDLTSLANHMIQLEKSLSDFQSQTRIQEQKDAAVLSDVLSQFTETNNELKVLKQKYIVLQTNHNSTLEKLRQLENDRNLTVVKLDRLQGDHNMTLQTLHQLQTDHNSTMVKLCRLETDHTSSMQNIAILQKNYTVTFHNISTLQSYNDQTMLHLAKVSRQQKVLQSEVGMSYANLSSAWSQIELVRSEMMSTSEQEEVKRDLSQLKRDGIFVRGNLSDVHQSILNVSDRLVPHVYFEAIANDNPTVVADQKVMIFDTLSLNIGGGYQNSTGVFVAPASGIYLFWAHITSFNNDHLTIHLYKNGVLLAEGISSRLIGTGTASITAITDVTKGEKVWFTKERGNAIYGKYDSHYGGMILNKI